MSQVRAQENLVFTEVSSGQLTESLDGVVIINWDLAGDGSFSNFGNALNPATGGLYVPFGGLSGVDSSIALAYQFLDPLNPGYYSDILVYPGFGTQYYYEDQQLNPFPYYSVFTVSTSPISDYMPNAVDIFDGGIAVNVSEGHTPDWIPVNITIEGPQDVPEPEGLLTVSIFGMAGVVIVVARRHLNAD